MHRLETGAPTPKDSPTAAVRHSLRRTAQALNSGAAVPHTCSRLPLQNAVKRRWALASSSSVTFKGVPRKKKIARGFSVDPPPHTALQCEQIRAHACACVRALARARVLVHGRGTAAGWRPWFAGKGGARGHPLQRASEPAKGWRGTRLPEAQQRLSTGARARR